MSLYENLVIEGGGMKNMACIGAYKYLEEHGHAQNITRFAGSSVGSMISLLFLIGYTSDELFHKLLNTNFRNYMITNPFMYPYNMLFKYGLNNGDKMIELLSSWMEEKTIDPKITFKQLLQQTRKTFVVTGTNISKRKVVYFNPDTYPDLPVLQAVRASINIPFFFTSVKIDGDFYIDGGVLMNFPLYYFDHKILPKDSISLDQPDKHSKSKSIAKTIGLVTQDANTNVNHVSYYGIQTIDHLLEYMIATGYTIFQALENNNIKDNYWNRSISIQLPREIAITEFKLSKDVMYELLNVGYSSAHNFFSNPSLESEISIPETRFNYTSID